MINYQEYLKETNQKDCRTSWIWWKVECCGMTVKEATKAAYQIYET